jgi:hypothetical protein
MTVFNLMAGSRSLPLELPRALKFIESDSAAAVAADSPPSGEFSAPRLAFDGR